MSCLSNNLEDCSGNRWGTNGIPKQIRHHVFVEGEASPNACGGEMCF